jgi:hypothetical protein
VLLEVVLDGGNESRHVLEGTASDPLVGDFSEPSLDKIQPRAGGRREVQVEARMSLQPRLHARMLVGTVVVDDEVKLKLRGFSVDLSQEPDELLVAMLRHAVPDDLAIQHAESSEERGRAVSLVVVSLPSRNTGTQGQQRLSAVERLDLTLLIDTQHEGLVGRIHVEADDIMKLLDEVLVPTELEYVFSLP